MKQQNERRLEIDLDAVLNNVKYIKKNTGKQILACVKCDGYGLGAVAVSRKIEPNVDWFGVATVDEAVSLRKAGIVKPILVLGVTEKQYIRQAINHRISLTIPSSDFINRIPASEPVSVHLKIDTGMGRLGIMPQELSETLKRINSRKNIKLEGVFSHLSSSEKPEKTRALKQIKIFHEVIGQLPTRLRVITHIANSGGIINIPESVDGFSMVRTGLLLYGVYPSLFLKTFHHIASLEYAICGIAKILLARKVPAGTLLSYNGKFMCKHETQIGIAGIGYGDGLDRALSNRFYMKYSNQLLPIRGNICMDQTILELTADIKQDEEIVFLDSELSAEHMAEIAHTVPHEILTRFGVSRINKVYRG
ncbi:MAG TPA: alanine racemase [bacterium]|nr:alanine racemase [bacterium]